MYKILFILYIFLRSPENTNASSIKEIDTSLPKQTVFWIQNLQLTIISQNLNTYLYSNEENEKIKSKLKEAHLNQQEKIDICVNRYMHLRLPTEKDYLNRKKILHNILLYQGQEIGWEIKQAFVNFLNSNKIKFCTSKDKENFWDNEFNNIMNAKYVEMFF